MKSATTVSISSFLSHHDLDRQLVRRGGLEFAQVHAHAAVAVDIDDDAVRLGELRAYGCRKAEAHRAHAAGG
jgi:hypothetical protein